MQNGRDCVAIWSMEWDCEKKNVVEIRVFVWYACFWLFFIHECSGFAYFATLYDLQPGNSMICRVLSGG